MYQQTLLPLVLLFNVILGQSSRVEYVNSGDEDLFVTLVHRDGILLPAGETYVITEFCNFYAEDVFAYPAKCQNQTCIYPMTYSGLVMQPLTDNINDTLTNYVIAPGGYNRAFTIESLDNSDCLIASCEIDLNQECPEELQVRDEEDFVVACNITDANTFIKFCPNAALILPDGRWSWFSCQTARVFRISFK